MAVSARSRLFLILLFNVLWVASTTAQERRGTITGRVVDSSQGILQGARIELQPGGQVVASDSHGEFTMNNLAPGKYTAVIEARDSVARKLAKQQASFVITK